MRLELHRGLGRAGEGDDVLAGEMFEQIAGGAHDELQRAARQNPGVQHDAHGRFGDIARRGGRFHDGRNACEQGRPELLQHTPDGEVEGVDVQGHALERCIDVLADERAPLPDRLHGAIDQDRVVGELAPALG